jgi:NADH dehydrogenase FAD-containing subunit
MKKKIVFIAGGFAGIQFVKNIDDKLFDILFVI